METAHRVYLFGDQTSDIDAGLRNLLQAQRHTIVSSFFQRCFCALRREISSLPLSEQRTFPRFTSIIDLLAKRYENGSNPALESALTCIFQLGCFITYHGDLGHAYPSPSDSHIIGLCTGLLSSAAVSISSNVGELLPAAVETVVLSLRLGLCVSATRELLGPKESVDGSWSALVPGCTVDEASKVIEDSSREKGISPSSTPYISAVGSNNVTVTAPPAILDDLINTGVFKRKPVTIAVYGPFHASHLYSELDSETILGHGNVESLQCGSFPIPVLSSNTGLPLQSTNVRDLFATALREILSCPLRWDKALASCLPMLQDKRVTKCKLLPIGTTATQSLVAALTRPTAGAIDLEVEDCSPPKEQIKTTNSPDSKATKDTDIAIIGMSGRFPEAGDVDSFWELLYKGLDVHREVPDTRWDIGAHVDLTGKRKNTSQVPYGCWINNPGLFDARFFSLSPREALQADPAQRLALLTAYEALEMAGIVPDASLSTQRNRIGIFYGMTSDDYREVNSGQDVDTYFIPGGNRAFTPGRINYFFKFSGPSISIDTACSSSLAAIHTACNYIWNNDCDTAIAGGVNVLTNPDNHTGLDRGHFLSRTGNCNTFDDGADGYCRADGVATLILKRLEDAQADNDPILGVIKGAYTNHSAEAVSMTRPHAGAQAFIFDKLLNETNTNPKSVSYIEMHGTGTQAGDAVEMQSVLDVFAPDYQREPEPVFLGSAKANIGHGESASGATSLIKVLLMMRNNMIPPHCGIKTKINHNFPTDLAQRGVHIASQPVPWQRTGGQRTAFVNNFSAAGGNTALLLEDAPSQSPTGHDPRPVHVIASSAKSWYSLKNNIDALVGYLDRQTGQSGLDELGLLASLAYTTTARRTHHSLRIIATCSSLQELRDSLQKSVLTEAYASVPTIPPKIGFVFTGQGCQYVGMGRHLYEGCARFRSQILRYDCIARNQGFPSIIPLISGSAESINELSPLVVQLGTTCLQVALVDYWKSLGVEPAFVIGHSLGDFAALCATGVVSVSDAIFLCGRRCQLLLEHCKVGTHSMLAVKASLSRVKQLLGDAEIDIACLNGPEETVVSGLRPTIGEVAQKCSLEGVKSTELKLPYAFHSAQVLPILGELKTAASKVSFQKPSIPFVSCLLGEVVTDVNADVLGADYMVRQCRETVNFQAGLKAARHAGFSNDETIWVEIGSHTICSALIKATVGPQVTTVASLRRDENAWKTLSQSISALHLLGISLNWIEFHQDFKRSHRVLPLPTYKWELKDFWIPYRNNFCLNKGAPGVTSEPASRVPFLTAAAQQIIEDRGQVEEATVVVQNDVAYPELNRVIQGHKVNGAALCPSSLYADIAQTLCNHLIRKYKPELEDAGLAVCDMTVSKPLIATGQQQLFRVSASSNWSSGCATIQVYSVTSEGKRTIDHAQCRVDFFNRSSAEQEFKRIQYLIKRSIESLERKAETGIAHRLQRGMVYKLFSALVDYDDNFKSIREVILDSGEYEATARVRFHGSGGNFYRSPYWIDSLGHLSGFVMNANDATDSANNVFVNHGWESMRCLKDFSPDTDYCTYVRMQPWKGPMWAGDVYIFEGDNIIAVSAGIKFQALERKILNTVLPPAGASQSRAPPAKQQMRVSEAADTQGKKAPLPCRPTANSTPPGIEQALNILASEVGLSADELTDDVVFADQGVDSLLSLTITGRYREELNLDLDSSVFIDYPTIAEFKGHLVGLSPPESTSDNYTSEETASFSSVDMGSPDSSASSSQSQSDNPTPDERDKTLKQIHGIIAQEVGLSVGDIPATQSLEELGVDSLLSLTVLSRLREELDLSLPDQFLMENRTIHDIDLAISADLKLPEPSPATPDSTAERQSNNHSSSVTQHPKATSLLLQGSPKTATKSLFLFPDGSGSATSYASVPGISPDVCVYGLNCPYMKEPEKLKCSLDELSSPYIQEIQRRQPHGPYNFAGWSAGGICAYDAARRLIIEHGEEVDRLILLDSPFPIGLEKLPHRLYDFFNSIGLFGEGKSPPPPWLLPHFLAFIDALDAYNAVPLPHDSVEWANKLPKTYLIWAKEGVCGKPGDPRPAPAADGSEDPREMAWLLNDRTDFGPNKWDTLVGPDNVMGIGTLEGANHFTMTKGEKGRELSAFMAAALDV